MDWRTGDHESARRLVESVAQRIDPTTRVVLLEPGRESVAATVRLALVARGAPTPFNVTEVECREADSAVGRERLARRLGAALGLQPPDQMTGPARG